MERPLRVLHLEDNDDDALLVRRRLQSAGLSCEISRVDGRDGFERALGQPAFDLIISDFALPGYTGASALRLAREKAPGVPFIFVSGTLGEDAAIESLVGGATDYILKSSDMKRLIPSVQRALRDVRERRERDRLEQQFRQAQKMEAIGRLASGVAHDFNNLLTSILGLAELNIRDLPEDNPIRKDLEEIVATSMRAADLTRQLLTFSRKQIVEPRVLCINDVLKSIEKLIRRIIGEDIRVVLKPASDLQPVKIDPGQLEQLIVNMAVNARDAMPDGGTITIETSNAALDEGFCERNPGAVPGEFVSLAIRDTGIGMSDEVKARIFEPFFTTKGPEKGTGLGLATCYGIAKQNAGYIAVDSAAGRGTTFTVYFPRAVGKPQAVAGRTAPDAGSAGRETILLVEDDARLRSLTCRILRGRGYEVLEAADVEQALRQVSSEAGRRARLLITDVVMPGTSGKEVAAELRRARPDLEVLFVSGHTDDVISHHGVLDSGINFLAKPFSAEGLSRKIREILEPRA